VLLLGMPGVGKSTAAIATSPAPVAVMLCEEEDALQYPKAASPYDFDHTETVRGWSSAQRALVELRDAVKAGAQTVVCDPFTDLGKILEKEALAAAGSNGFEGYRVFFDRVMSILDSLFRLECHVIACAHYLEKEGKMLPLFSGQVAVHVMKRFTDRVWMDIKPTKDNQDVERVFITGPTPTMSGPSCRNASPASKGTFVLPASIEVLFAHFAEMRAEAEKASAGPPAKTASNVSRLRPGVSTKPNQTKK